MIAFERAPGDHCRRTADRNTVARPSTIRADGVPARDVVVDDLSSEGFSFGSAAPFAPDTVLSVGLAGAGCAEARVIWRDHTRHGCVFEPPLTAAQLDAAFTHARGVVLIESFVAAERSRIWLPHRRAALMLVLGIGGWFLFAAVARAF